MNTDFSKNRAAPDERPEFPKSIVDMSERKACQPTPQSLSDGTDKTIAQLQDEVHEAAAILAGKQMRLAYRNGDVVGARLFMQEMNAHTHARIAARAEGCYFMEQGEDHGREILAREAARG